MDGICSQLFKNLNFICFKKDVQALIYIYKNGKEKVDVYKKGYYYSIIHHTKRFAVK